MPSLRQTSSIGVPVSACLSVKVICWSVNLDFFCRRFLLGNAEPSLIRLPDFAWISFSAAVQANAFLHDRVPNKGGESFTSAGGVLAAQDVMGVLQYLFAVRGMLEHLRSGNDPDFVSVSYPG